MKSSDNRQKVLVIEPSFVEDPKAVGRPYSLSDEKLNKLLDLYYTTSLSLRQLADMFGVSRMTVWRAVQTAKVFANPR